MDLPLPALPENSLDASSLVRLRLETVQSLRIGDWASHTDEGGTRFGSVEKLTRDIVTIRTPKGN